MFYPFGGFQGMIFLIPAIILAMYAQYKVQSTFRKYLQVHSRRGSTGEEVARRILDSQGLDDVRIDLAGGHLTDHYDPRRKVLRLSKEVYYGSSLASIGVAAHESGHAIQHAHGYIPLAIRNAIVPIASFGSQAAFIFILMGLFFTRGTTLIDVGILLFSAAVLFQVITLPVEFNASSRAVELLVSGNYIAGDEERKVRKVLSAAALTYVAAAATAVAQLMRLLLLRNNRRR